MNFPSLERWLAGSITVAIFTVLLILRGPPGAGNAEALPPVPELPPAKDGGPSWPMYGGSPSRNMVAINVWNLPEQWTDDDGKLIQANVRWSAELGSRSYGGVVVAGGKVFVGTNNQAPRDLKYKTVKVHKFGDVLTKIDGKPVKNEIDIQEVLAKYPFGKGVDCSFLRDGLAVDAQLYVAPVDLGVLMAFNQADGKFLYQTVFPKLANGQVNDWPLEGLCSAPTAEGDRLYFTSNRCEVVCVDIKTGAFIWKLDMVKELGVFPHNMTAGSPVIVGDDLYVTTSNGVDEGHQSVPAPQAPSFLKLDKKTGKVLWQDNSPTMKFGQAPFFNLVNRAEMVQHGQWSSPAYAVVNGQPQIVFPAGDGWIRSYSPQGNLIWQFDCNPKDTVWGIGAKGSRSDFIGVPVIYKDRVYIGIGQDPEHLSGVGHLWCIDMTRKGDVSPELVVNAAVWPPVTKPNPNSAKVWHLGGFIPGGMGRFHFGRTMSTCAVHDGLLYTADLRGTLYCLDAKKGTLYWEHDAQSEIWSSPCWADGKIYLGTDAGDVWVFAHGKQKKLLGRNEMGRAVRGPVVAVGDTLYVVCGRTLYALKK